MDNSRLRLVAVAILSLAAGFFIGSRQAGPHVETGRAQTNGVGGGSIITDGWTYGFSADVAWTDANGSQHEGGPVECLPPLSSVEGVKFAWVEVQVEGTGWRPVVWIDCRGVPLPSSSPPATSPGESATPTTIPAPAADLIFRSADQPEPPDPAASINYGCVGVGFDPVTLHGEESGPDQLVWVEDSRRREYALVWPPGFSAQFSPLLQVLDADGAVVAVEGDVLELGGTPDPDYSNLFLVWEINRVVYGCW